MNASGFYRKNNEIFPIYFISEFRYTSKLFLQQCLANAEFVMFCHSVKILLLFILSL